MLEPSEFFDDIKSVENERKGRNEKKWNAETDWKSWRYTNSMRVRVVPLDLNVRRTQQYFLPFGSSSQSFNLHDTTDLLNPQFSIPELV